jgi:hypothetical protein
MAGTGRDDDTGGSAPDAFDERQRFINRRRSIEHRAMRHYA